MTGDDASRREAGERVVDQLADAGIEYVFATYGTDHPPLIRGLARADEPTPVLVPDETIAASAAHGYAQATGEPAAVLVHVDVGTANLGPSLHNAARSRVPMVVLAGRTPLTTRGQRPGSRSIFVHYYQDVYDQHGIVREYTKWEYDLATAAAVDDAVARGVRVANDAPQGPVYLTLPREVLREGYEPGSAPAPPETPPATLAPGTRDRLADRIVEADSPLLVTSYLGREPEAVSTLVAFAETADVPVVEAAPAFDLNFPRDHPLHAGFDATPHLPGADLVLVVACDVPWIPSRVTPREDAAVVHLDVDPVKGQYPLWDIRTDLAVAADPERALSSLTDAIESRGVAIDRDRARDGAGDGCGGSVADPDDADVITPELLSATVGEILDPGDVVVDETVTNTPAVLEHVARTEPDTYYSYCSSGLGWASGAVLGVKLARPDRRVVATVGDGSFALGNPLASLQVARSHDLAHLAVVYNNRGWRAVGDAIRDQYGEPGFDDEPYARMEPSIDFAAGAESQGCHGESVTDPAALPGALERGLDAVDDGTPAVVDVALATR